MPEIKNEDLLSLHYQIEKAEVEQRKLEDLLNEKSVELKKNRTSKFLFKVLSSVLLIITITLILYAVYRVDSKKKYTGTQELISFKSEIKVLKNQLNQLEKNQSDLDEIKDLYVYRSLIDKDTVYSVQVQTFTNDKITTVVSDKYTNTRLYGDTSYFKLSLGIFETLAEAQEFRKFLIKSSIIQKNIFVISYRDGKRIRIENPF